MTSSIINCSRILGVLPRRLAATRGDRDMATGQIGRLKTAAIDETRKLARIFIYLWLVLCLLAMHRALIQNDEFLRYHLGLVLFNALALAKVILILEDLHLFDQLKNKPLVYPILFKSTVFAVILFCFHVIEETIAGMLHGKTLSHSILDIGGGTVHGMLLVGVIMFVVLVPFITFIELERAIGAKEMSDLLFGRKTGNVAVPPAHADPEKP
jgi:hypothetical protein